MNLDSSLFMTLSTMDLIQRPGQPDPEADEAYHSDEEAANEMLDTVLHHITLTGNETHTVRPPACVSYCVFAINNHNALVVG